MSNLHIRKLIGTAGRFALTACLIADLIFASGCSYSAKEASSVIDEAETTAEQTKSIEYVYGIPMDENAAVVTDTVADIYENPDVKSNRLTQVLCNQPVSTIELESGWAKVKTVDGTTGWIKRKYLNNDISGIYGRSFTHRIIVTSKEKTITSGISGGTTLANAPMGSEFYTFNSSGDAYEVYLSGSRTGWIQSSGIIHVDLGKKIPVTNPEDFASTALRLKGTRFMLNGLSYIGIDAPGLVYICARINGIDLPRTIEGQMQFGVEIDPEAAQAGDIVFMSLDDKVSCVGICTGNGEYVYSGRKTGYVTIGKIDESNKDGIVTAARRIFN
jgi:SH3-like domain-containing protein